MNIGTPHCLRPRGPAGGSFLARGQDRRRFLRGDPPRGHRRRGGAHRRVRDLPEAGAEVDLGGRFVAPGFIDAHVHIESAMASPTEFARAVLPHGTTTVVADPHEIANVMGRAGIDYMLQAPSGPPLQFLFTSVFLCSGDGHGNRRCHVDRRRSGPPDAPPAGGGPGGRS